MKLQFIHIPMAIFTQTDHQKPNRRQLILHSIIIGSLATCIEICGQKRQFELRTEYMDNLIRNISLSFDHLINVFSAPSKIIILNKLMTEDDSRGQKKNGTMNSFD